MAQNDTATDARSDELKTGMAEYFADFEAEYRGSDWANIVYEDDEVVVIEDTKAHESSEWQDEFGDGFSETMHDLADQLVDRRWPASYPVVFDKLE
jgi:hypothetical protein